MAIQKGFQIDFFATSPVGKYKQSPLCQIFDETNCRSFTLIMTNPLFLSAEHCIGYVTDAPASPLVKSNSKKKEKMICFGFNKKIR